VSNVDMSQKYVGLDRVCLFYILHKEVQRKVTVEIRKSIDSNNNVFVETGAGKARAGASFASRSNLHKRWANVRMFRGFLRR
jgi:hypothetical protein